MTITAIVEALVECGATPQMILAAVRAAEATNDSALDKRRAKDAERQRRRREKKAGHVTSRDVTVTERDTSSLPPSPEPPTTNLSPVTPLNPPAADKAPAPKPPPLAEQIWSIASKPSRERSGRGQVGRAVTAALAKGATPQALIASVKAHCSSAGEFAKGVHRLIEGEHWRDFLERPPDPVSEAEKARRARHFAATGEWKPGWGERPQAAA